MKNLSLRLDKHIFPQGLPVHLLLETGLQQAEVSALELHVIPVDLSQAGALRAPIRVESVFLAPAPLTKVFRVDTSQIDPGEYLAILTGNGPDIEWEESFWVLSLEDYQNMLDTLQEEFDERIRIRRADLLLLLRRKLIEMGDEAELPDQDEALSEHDILLQTQIQANFLTGGSLAIAPVNFGFDCLLEDFMYLNAFSVPDRAGPRRRIAMNVDENGHITIHAAIDSLHSAFEDFSAFEDHSAAAEASRRWPQTFGFDSVFDNASCHLTFTISQNLRGKFTVAPATAQASEPVVYSEEEAGKVAGAV